MLYTSVLINSDNPRKAVCIPKVNSPVPGIQPVYCSARPSGLHVRLCHAFSVIIKELVLSIDFILGALLIALRKKYAYPL